MNKEEIITWLTLNAGVTDEMAHRLIINSLLSDYAEKKAIQFADWLGKKELNYAIETGEWHDGFMGKSTKEWYETFKEETK